MSMNPLALAIALARHIPQAAYEDPEPLRQLLAERAPPVERPSPPPPRPPAPSVPRRVEPSRRYQRSLPQLPCSPEPPPPKRLTPAHIVRVTAWRYGVDLAAMIGPARLAQLAEPRHMAAYLCHTLLGCSSSTIGRFLGRDGSTVRYSIRRITAFAAEHATFGAELAALAAEIRRPWA